MGVSVVIPTYNRCKFVLRAIKSVMGQTRKADEIIVVDNGSSDNTCKLVKSNFPTVKIIVEPKRGVSAARNIGIRSAKHTWIAFLDSDDQWKKRKLETIIKQVCNSKKKQKIWHSDEIWIRNGNFFNQKLHHKKSGGYIFENCLKMCCISPSSVIIHKSIFQDYGLFDEKLEVCEDYDFWIRVSSKEKVGFIDRKLVIKHGGHSDQLSKKFWGMDRFRIISLINLAKTVILDHDQKKLVKREVIAKLKILVAGAEKRKNSKVINMYQPILEKWLSISNSDTSVWVR